MFFSNIKNYKMYVTSPLRVHIGKVVIISLDPRSCVYIPPMFGVKVP